MENQMMTALTDIIIEGAGSYQSILSLKINTAANEHGMFICRLRLEEDEIFVNEEDRTGNRILVKDKKDKLMFCGICTNSRIAQMSAYAELELVGKGMTIEADKEPRSRTFQDASKTLQDILNAVMSEYGAVIVVGNDKQIPSVVVQDGETDWKFIIRIANQYGLDIYSNVSMEGIVIQVGSESVKNVELGSDGILLEVYKDLGEMRDVSSNEAADFNTCQFTGDIVQTSNRDVMAGNGVSDRIIKNCSISSEQGVLVSKVELQNSADSRPLYRNASGALLESRILTGEVIEVNGTSVKVKFDVDDSQDKATAMELPYETVFNNSFYCMPDEGDRIFAYVDNMGEAVILGSIRSDCSDLFFETPMDKAITSLDNMIRFNMDSLALTANREQGTKSEISKVSLELDNSAGINVHATGAVVIRSLQDISIVSTYKDELDIQKITETIQDRAKARCDMEGQIYDAANGDEKAYGGKIRRWYSDGGKDLIGDLALLKDERIQEVKELGEDIGNSFLNLGKSMILYDFWGNKNEVTVHDESETFENGTVCIYGDKIMLSAGDAILYLGLGGQSVIYINADVLNWMGLSKNTGYEIVSDSVKSGWDTALNYIAVGLDILATVCCIFCGPVGAAIGLGICAGFSLLRGDYAGAVLSAIPILGCVGKSAKRINSANTTFRTFTVVTTTLSTASRTAVWCYQSKDVITSIVLAIKTGNYDEIDVNEVMLWLLQTVDIGLGVYQGTRDFKRGAPTDVDNSKTPEVDAPKTNLPDTDANITHSRTTTADPVDVITGGLSVAYTDLIVPDIRDDFRLVRTYSSTSMKRAGILGRYWKYNVESHAHIAQNHVRIILPDMHAEEFTCREGSWENTRTNRKRYALREEDGQYVLKDALKGDTYTYDKVSGNLTATEDCCGNKTHYMYEGNKVVQISLTSGLEIYFTYEGDRLAAVEDSAKRKCTFRYRDDLLVEENGPNGGRVTYRYTPEGCLTHITNEAGKCYVQNQYDRRGRVTRQQTADGEEYIFMYDDANRQNTVTTMSNGRRVTYCYNREQLVWKTIYADNTEEIKEYDANECVIMEKDRCGSTIYRTYDENGSILSEELPSGLKTQYSYDKKGMLVTVSDNMGRVTRYKKNAQGIILRRREQIEQDVWAECGYTYDSHGRLLSETDANGNTKTWKYETLFRHPTQYSDSEGNEIHYSLNELGRNMATASARGNIEYAYNALGFITAVTDEEGNTTRYRYDVTGNKVALIRPEQVKSGEYAAETYQYDAMEHLVGVTDELGNVRAVHVNSDGKLTKLINPDCYDADKKDGEGITFHYDTDGNRTDICYPTGGTKKYLYDACGRITKEINAEEYELDGADGAGQSYEYDSAGRLVQVTDTLGNVKKRYVYDMAGRVIKEIGSKGYGTAECDEDRAGVIYRYNLAGWVTEQRTPVETDDAQEVKYRLVKYAYDRCGNLTEEKRYLEPQGETSASGRILIIRKEYDRQNRITRVSDSTGACVEYGYNAYHQKITERVRINQHTDRLIKYQYNRNGWLACMEQSTDKKGCGTAFARTSFRYDGNGNLTEIETPGGNRIMRVYDAAGRLVREEHLEKGGGIDNKITYEYDRAGNIIRIGDRDGLGTVNTFDVKGRLVQQTDKAGGSTLFFYDRNDRITREVTPNLYAKYGRDAKGIGICYDTEGRCVRRTYADGGVDKEYAYNAHGEVESIKDAAGGGARLVYDFAGRRVAAYSHGGSMQKTAYDVWGNVTGVADGEDKWTHFDLDPWGRVTEITRADGSKERYTYDFAGNVTGMTDGEGNTTTYQYNTLNKLETRTDASGASESWMYDIEGNIYAHTDRRGIKTFHEYNMYHSLTRRYESGGNQSERWGYYPDGRLAYAEGGGRRYDYSYHVSGLLKEKRCGSRILVGYEYDLDGNITVMTDHTGKSVRYLYDDCGLLEYIYDGSALLAEYGYYPDHSRKMQRIGSDIFTEYAYDVDKNLESLHTYIGGDTGVPQILASNKYTYDNNGRMTEKETLDGTTRYTYNEVNALVKAEYPGYEDIFEYDHAGNRTGWTSRGMEEKYSYDTCGRLVKKTRLSGETSETAVYEYDRAGNLLQDDKAVYRYDSFNRNVQTMTNDGNVQVNRYDGEGLRAELEENGRIASYVFAGRDVLTETDAEGYVSRFLRGHTIISCDSEKAKTYYHYVSDELGSITHLVADGKDNGQNVPPSERVRSHYVYDAFGLTTVCEENVENRFRYTGEQYDSITGQYYLKARFYNPVTARFTQEDTYHGDGLNLYTYCYNNPVSYTDPTGHEARPAAEKYDINDYIDHSAITINDYIDNSAKSVNDYIDKYSRAMNDYIDKYSGGASKQSSKGMDVGKGIDFYVTPGGEVVPSTAYRYMDSKYAEQTMKSMSAPGSYFGFKKFDSARNAQDAFQIAPEWSDCKLRGEFDTLQVIDKMYVPKAYGDKGPGLEPFTRCYPEYGKGGCQQFIYRDTIYFKSVDIIGD